MIILLFIRLILLARVIQFLIDYKINFHLTFCFQGKKINERATYFSSISLINLTMMQYRLKFVSKLILVASVKISKKIERFRHIYDLSKTGKSISITLVFMVVVKISCGKC